MTLNFLEKGEYLIDILETGDETPKISGCSLQTMEPFKSPKQSKISMFSVGSGNFYITNKRIIFLSAMNLAFIMGNSKYDHYFYHSDILTTHGKNGRFLVAGTFNIVPAYPVKWINTKFGENTKDKEFFHYNMVSYGGDLADKMNNMFYNKEALENYKNETKVKEEKELEKLKDIKERSMHFFLNDSGDYLAIFEDHLKMKVYDDNKVGYNYPSEYKYISFEERIAYDGLMISFSKDGGTSGCPHIHFGRHGQWNKDEIIYFRNVNDWENVKNLIGKAITEYGKIKVNQKIVHGDEVTKTEIKDSVLNRSNVGGGSSKIQQLKDLTEMKKEGLIDDDEFKQIKKEIIG